MNEHARLHDRSTPWKKWGPYLAERAWGTVREDYSDGGAAWDYFPHDHARSRAYRWSEDGLAGICDDQQQLCLAFAFWNGRDPILKERIFGLGGPEGNHGEDAKEYWFYLDSTPTHSWMRWRYLYPQEPFPYERLVDENRRRGQDDREFELLDTGVFDGDRYWEITVEYAKDGPDDICARVTARNAGPDVATLHVIPTLWFRNTWSWGLDDRRPMISVKENTLVANHHDLGSMTLSAGTGAVGLACDNESNGERLWGDASGSIFPKDAINDYIVQGAGRTNPDGTGTKAALWNQVDVEPGHTVEFRYRLSPTAADTGPTWEAVISDRRREADEFYDTLLADTPDDERAIARQAFAGLLWSKQWFHFDVDQWLSGDPSQPQPPASRVSGRNHEWRHLNNADVISMPDTWEYPWYAAWDLAFHCVAFAHIDPEFSKQQLLLMCREWYMHPNGQLPAYEWAFGDVNPPVHAWAAMRVFELDGATDFAFLERIMHKLLLNFTWWINRKDAEGNNVFAGGFLGLDNIGPIDRSAPLPIDGHLEQSDGTAWMAMYCLDLLEMALTLARHDIAYEDVATKFFEHFVYIAKAMHERGLWNEEDGFYYDVLQIAGGDRIPLKVRSMVGLLPLAATLTIGKETLAALPDFAARFHWFLANRSDLVGTCVQTHTKNGGDGWLLAVVSAERLPRVMERLLDPEEFLSPYGIRALSAVHREHPLDVDLGGMRYRVDYAPGESTSGLFGGNSNWRGPIWFPVNYLVIGAVRRFGRVFGDSMQVELPTGSGTMSTLDAAADELADRLVGIFRRGEDGRRAVYGTDDKFQTDPAWNDLIPFYEYFHGDTGRGVGASHQTGWTALVADLIIGRNAPDASTH